MANDARPVTLENTAVGGYQTEVANVLRNTYMLLGMTLAFSAVCAGIGMAMNMPPLGLLMLLPYFALLYGVHKLQNSPWGIVMVFALTGWMGLTLAPLLNYYLANVGSQPIILALGTTAAVFFAASGYVLTTRKELSGWTGFLMTGLIVAFIAGIANVFLQIPGLSLAVSSMFALLSAGVMMWQTSAIIHGGERNYLLATVTLFVSIYNLFTSLLHLIGFASDD
jgi:modulator of FtsH protease